MAAFDNQAAQTFRNAGQNAKNWFKELRGETPHLSERLLAHEKLKNHVLLAANPDLDAAKLEATISRLWPVEAILGAPEHRNLPGPTRAEATSGGRTSRAHGASK